MIISKKVIDTILNSIGVNVINDRWQFKLSNIKSIIKHNKRKNIKTVNINLFAGPGVGKSTIAAQLFAILKMKHKDAELVTEYAKSLTYKKDIMTLSDQFYIAGKQHNKLHRLLNHNLEYIIHDSPFIMGLTYVNENGHLPIQEFTDFMVKLYNSYNNLNIFLERNTELNYQQVGRNQTLDQATEKDNEIKQLLLKHKIPFIIVKVGETTINDILHVLHI